MSESSETKIDRAGEAKIPNPKPEIPVHVNEHLEIPRLRRLILTLSISIGLFLAMLDSSIVATSLYVIGIEYKSIQTVNWVALAYTLAYLGLAIVVARLSDVVGRRKAYLACLILFIAFSIGCATAKSLNQLIAFRALQGIGGSGLYSLGMIMFPEITPPRNTKHIASIAGLVIAAAGVSGPVIGGLLTDKVNWRWIFWINVPIGAFALILFFLSWPSPEYFPYFQLRHWRTLDLPGSILVVAASMLVVFSFQYTGGQQLGINWKGWGQPTFIAPLICGLVSAVALITWEWLVDSRWSDKVSAVLPLLLFKNRVYAAGILNTALIGFPYFTAIYAYPVRIQAVNGVSSWDAGLNLLPMLAGVALGSALGGAINSKRNWICESLVGSGCLMLLGTLLLANISSTAKHDGKAMAYLAIMGLGFGVTASTSTMLAVFESPIREHAPAQGILAQARVFGGSLGIAATTLNLGSKARDLIVKGELTPADLVGHGTTGSDSVRKMFTDAFTLDMYVSAAVTGASIIAALATFRRYKNRPTSAQREQQLKQEQMDRRQTVLADS